MHFPVRTLAGIVAGLVGLAVLATSSACSWSQYPDRNAAVAEPFDLTEGDGGDTRRRADQLMLMPDGLWAYLTENPPDLRPGALAVATPKGRLGGGRHLFAVVARTHWGLRLQRLDTEAIDTRSTATYELRAVGKSDRLERLIDPGVDTCIVRKSFERSSCLDQAPPGTRWTLYTIGDGGRLAVDGAPGAMPISKAGLVERGPSGGAPTVVAPANHDGPWLAVAAPRPARPVPMTSVAADPTCKLDASTADGLHVRILERSVPPVDHPLEVTNAAYRFGVDALLDCRDDRTSLAVPTLFRPTLSTPEATMLGPPVLGARPVLLRNVDPPGRTLAAAALAHLAAGNPGVANLVVERLVRRGIRGDDNRLMLGSMQIAAAAGRPEEAYRYGHRASTTDWNRDNNPEYLLGRAAADAAVGKSREFYATRESAVEAAGRVDRSRLTAWLEWTGRLRKAATGDLSRADLRRLAGDVSGRETARWSAATTLLATRQDVPLAPIPLEASAERRLNVSALAAGLRGEQVPSACSDGADCPFDVYGRRIAAALGSAEDGTSKFVRRTLLMGRAVFQPGLHIAIGASSSGEHRLALLAALAPQLDRRAEGEIADMFDERLSAAVVDAIRGDGACGPAVSAAVRERLALEGRILDHPHPRLRVLDWLLNGDGGDVCDDPAGAARSLVSLAADSPEMRRFLTPVFPALVERADSAETRRTVVAHAADFAADHGLAGTCKRWRLALAAASARSGDHRRAEAELEAAVNCGADNRYDRAESILIAFVAFMRSGTLPRRVDSRLRSDLQRLVRHRVDAACTGLADFDYHLAAALPDDIVELADSLEVSRPNKNDGMLTVRSTRDDLAAGRTALEAAKHALADGDFASASDELATADRHFSRLEHAPGLAQTRFLRRMFVPNELRASPNGDANDESGGSDDAAAEPGEAPPSLPGVADSCELDPEAIPSSAAARRCLLTEHGATRLADTWSGRLRDASEDERAFLTALFLVDGRTQAVRNAAKSHDLPLCRRPR